MARLRDIDLDPTLDAPAPEAPLLRGPGAAAHGASETPAAFVNPALDDARADLGGGVLAPVDPAPPVPANLVIHGTAGNDYLVVAETARSHSIFAPVIRRTAAVPRLLYEWRVNGAGVNPFTAFACRRSLRRAGDPIRFRTMKTAMRFAASFVPNPMQGYPAMSATACKSRRMFLGAALAAATLALAGAAQAAPRVEPDMSQRVEIVIDKRTQKMTVFVGGQQRHVFTVSTGRAGYATPSGTFRPTHQVPMAISVKYGNTPMPHSIFFTGVGHAIHATKAIAQLGRVASHGCIRLSPENAKIVYDLVKEKGLHNTVIKIV